MNFEVCTYPNLVQTYSEVKLKVYIGFYVTCILKSQNEIFLIKIPFLRYGHKLLHIVLLIRIRLTELYKL